jgi:hypothetical protein
MGSMPIRMLRGQCITMILFELSMRLCSHETGSRFLPPVDLEINSQVPVFFHPVGRLATRGRHQHCINSLCFCNFHCMDALPSTDGGYPHSRACRFRWLEAISQAPAQVAITC